MLDHLEPRHALEYEGYEYDRLENVFEAKQQIIAFERIDLPALAEQTGSP
jgi:hypothetical protein